MKNSRKLAIALAGLVAIQLVPVKRDNPPVLAEVPAPEPVRELLVRACYDCHSNATVWPWYAFVAPVSWLVAWDVSHGRDHVNFHRWSADPEDLAHGLEEVAEVVEEEAMPLPIYLPLHPEAQLTAEERQTLVSWAKALAAETRRGAEPAAGD